MRWIFQALIAGAVCLSAYSGFNRGVFCTSPTVFGVVAGVSTGFVVALLVALCCALVIAGLITLVQFVNILWLALHPVSRLSDTEFLRLCKAFGHLKVGPWDSMLGGNCIPGTLEFLWHFPFRMWFTGLTIDELLPYRRRTKLVKDVIVYRLIRVGKRRRMAALLAAETQA